MEEKPDENEINEKQAKRFEDAGERLREIQRKIAPFVKPHSVKIVSTAGKWRHQSPNQDNEDED